MRWFNVNKLPLLILIEKDCFISSEKCFCWAYQDIRREISFSMENKRIISKLPWKFLVKFLSQRSCLGVGCVANKIQSISIIVEENKAHVYRCTGMKSVFLCSQKVVLRGEYERQGKLFRIQGIDVLLLELLSV